MSGLAAHMRKTLLDELDAVARDRGIATSSLVKELGQSGAFYIRIRDGKGSLRPETYDAMRDKLRPALREIEAKKAAAA